MLASFGFLSLRSQDPGRYNYQMTNRSGVQPPAADRRLRVVLYVFHVHRTTTAPSLFTWGQST